MQIVLSGIVTNVGKSKEGDKTYISLVVTDQQSAGSQFKFSVPRPIELATGQSVNVSGSFKSGITQVGGGLYFTMLDGDIKKS